MNKRKILRCLLSVSIVGSLFCLGSMEAFAEWRNESGSWKCVENGSNVTGWHKYNDNWYYFNNEGTMQTGWVKDNGSWYYLKDSGDMRTGWVKYKNQWYYLNVSGQMQTDWVNDNGTWYYLNKDGAMQTGVISVDGKVYYLNESGAMQTGSVAIDGETYEFNISGEAVGKIPNVDKDKIFGTVINTTDNSNATNNEAKTESTETNEESSSSSSSHSHRNDHSSSKEDKKYNLVWEENFDGDKLDETNWNYEKHQPGWVNNELQEYTDSKDNIFVKDGNLVLKAIKTEKDGKEYYTSGKVTTQNKKTFKYGKFEIKAKTPKGQGLWPALWMMPNNENLYGQWPKCGEIDIMEVLGHEPEKAYGTIHYGDPHEEKQGTYTLNQGSFADDYHVYGLEWEPGEMRFYIDGNLYHTVKDWFTKVDGSDEKTFPAPFDQPFYLQCNLAVGGSWPGNPDNTTDFNNAELKVDYIKVYQLDNYDENVKKPDPEKVVLRDPDANGNYIVNGDFSKDDGIWELKQALGGAGTFDVGQDRMKYWEVESKTQNAKVDVTNINNSRELKVSINNEKTSLDDVKVKQTNLALKANNKYVLYFDAYADKKKNIVACINGENMDAEITDKKNTFKYEFTTGEEVNSKDLEFLLGTQGVSYIDNVRIEENSLIRNGSFDSGLVGWEVFKDGNISSAVSSGVDSLKEKNAVQLEIADTGDADWKIQLKQSNVKLEEGKKYKLSFNAKSTIDRDIMYAIQRDGSKDDNWDAYTGSNKIKVGKDFETYTLGFEMKKPTDANSIFTISMGAVNNKQIKDKHIVTIDNVVLEEVDKLDDIPDEPALVNDLVNEGTNKVEGAKNQDTEKVEETVKEDAEKVDEVAGNEATDKVQENEITNTNNSTKNDAAKEEAVNPDSVVEDNSNKEEADQKENKTKTIEEKSETEVSEEGIQADVASDKVKNDPVVEEK